MSKVFLESLLRKVSAKKLIHRKPQVREEKVDKDYTILSPIPLYVEGLKKQTSNPSKSTVSQKQEKPVSEGSNKENSTGEAKQLL